VIPAQPQGAAVYLAGDDGRPVAREFSDQDGFYHFQGVAPGRLRVVAVQGLLPSERVPSEIPNRIRSGWDTVVLQKGQAITMELTARTLQ
jgi:hypothetical protein